MGKRAALALTVIIAFCLTACGSGSSGTDRSPLKMSEFTEQADAICKEEQEALEPAIDAVATGFQEASSPQQIREVAGEGREVVARMRAGLDRLRKLPPPPEKKKAITAMLNVAYAQARDSLAVADAAGASDERRIEAISGRIVANAKRYERLADRLGFGYCGHPH